MKFSAIFEFVLTVSLAAAFNVRGLKNYTSQQQLVMSAMQKNKAGYYSRITNGIYAEDELFPYQVGLETWYEGLPSRKSGGSLISHRWVLTAAHCLMDGISVSVYLGSIIFDEPRQAFHHVRRSKMIEHEDFVRNTFEHDIGLVEIPYVRYTRYIGAVDFPPRNFPHYIDSYAFLAGWGVTSDISDDSSPYLMYDKFRIMLNSECAEIYGSTKIYDGKVCTATSDGISPCKGDSGGPLVLEGTKIQIGIASFAWALGCESGHPVAYTRVTSYLEWIHEKTGLLV